MTEFSTLEKIRLQKLEELRAEGIEPYPTRAARTHTSAEAIAEFESAEKEGREVKATLAGGCARRAPWASCRLRTSRTGRAGCSCSSA